MDDNNDDNNKSLLLALDLMCHELFTAGEQKTWLALTQTCQDLYYDHFVPVDRQCDKVADALLADVQRAAERLARIRNDQWLSAPQDGCYEASDTCECTAFPREHEHQCRVIYTRFGRDLDTRGMLPWIGASGV